MVRPSALAISRLLPRRTARRLDDGNGAGQIVTQHSVHLVLDLIEAPDRAASEDLGKLGEVVASHLKTAGLGGEVVPDELQRLVIRQIPEMRDVVPDERSQVVIDDRDLLLISL